jgi:hypothetical protein
MVDLRTLTPAERARQLGHPEGEIGVAIAESLNTLNRGVNEAVFQRLGLIPKRLIGSFDPEAIIVLPAKIPRLLFQRWKSFRYPKRTSRIAILLRAQFLGRDSEQFVP